jgi:hypothetical protein
VKDFVYQFFGRDKVVKLAVEAEELDLRHVASKQNSTKSKTQMKSDEMQKNEI